MQVHAVRTHKVTTEDTLEALVDRHIPVLAERSVVIVTSKILSIMQGRMVSRDAATKAELIHAEADWILETETRPYNMTLTVTRGVLLPSAGIDESNADGGYLLYPCDIDGCAIRLWQHLRATRSLSEVGVLITDSHTTMLRRGVTGVALGWCGFAPLYSYVGKPDLDGAPLRMTHINILDALAVAGVFVMGEGNEQTPLAVIEDAPRMQFLDRSPTKEEVASCAMPMKDDLYAPILCAAKWTRGGGGHKG